MNPIRRTTVAVTTAALLSLGVLTGCSSDDVGEEVGEKIIENELGGDADIDIDSDGEEVTIDDGEGNTYTSGGDLPDDFPEDDIPLVDGDIISAVGVDSGDGRNWAISIKVDGSGEDAYADAVSRLEGAGFSQQGESYPDTLTGQFASDEWDVVLVAFEAAGSTTVGYTVNAN